MRLNFIVEGQTEETFVRDVIIPHLASSHSVWGKVRCVTTNRKRKIRGGGFNTNYKVLRDDILLWMKEDQNLDMKFTTMLDLYALPPDFPGYNDAGKHCDAYQRVDALERAFGQDIQDTRFIPYIQLHEFEALLLADPQKLDWEYLKHDQGIRNLVDMVSHFDSPELIDDGQETAPSKRIIREIPEYEGMKASAGPIVAEKIGLPTLRDRCRHFNNWLSRLEQVGSQS
jgi:hypothetical protein